MKRVVRSAALVMVMGATLGAQTMTQSPAMQGQGQAMGQGSAMSNEMAMMHGFMPFSKEAFQSAMESGKTTLVFFHAPWCPVCKAQEPKVLAHLQTDAKEVVALKVDYDSNPALRKEMNVTKQSTLILFRGKSEIARISYVSDDKSIDDLFAHVAMKTMKGGK